MAIRFYTQKLINNFQVFDGVVIRLSNQDFQKFRDLQDLAKTHNSPSEQTQESAENSSSLHREIEFSYKTRTLPRNLCAISVSTDIAPNFLESLFDLKPWLLNDV
jgi:hypothetical protein